MSTRGEVEAFMYQFYSVFTPDILNDANAFDALVEHYFLPLTILEDGTVVSLREDDIREKLKLGIKANADQGWVSTRSDYTEVAVLNDKLALVTRGYTRLKTDSSVLDEGAATYTVIKKDGRWLVTFVVMHGAGEKMSLDVM